MTDIAKEYATALFSLALETGNQDGYTEELKTVKTAFEKDENYIQLLSSPNIPMSQRLNFIDEAFSKDVSEYVLSFLKLLCEKGRIALFFDVFVAFNELLDASKKILNIKVKSAVELSDSQKSKLLQKLESANGCKVNLEYHIDSALIGGIIIENEDKLLDGSIRNQLQQVKEVIGS